MTTARSVTVNNNTLTGSTAVKPAVHWPNDATVFHDTVSENIFGDV